MVLVTRKQACRTYPSHPLEAAGTRIAGSACAVCSMGVKGGLLRRVRQIRTPDGSSS